MRGWVGNEGEREREREREYILTQQSIVWQGAYSVSSRNIVKGGQSKTSRDLGIHIVHSI